MLIDHAEPEEEALSIVRGPAGCEFLSSGDVMLRGDHRSALLREVVSM